MKASNALVAAALAGVFAASTAVASAAFVPAEKEKEKDDCPGKDKEKKELAINWEDELVQATALTRGGAIVHPQFGGTSSAKPAKADSDEGDAGKKPATAAAPKAAKTASAKKSAAKPATKSKSKGA